MTRLLAILSIIAALAVSASSRAAEDTPSARVETLNAGLLEIMETAEGLGYEGRIQAFAKLLPGTYNLPLMARIAAGRYWKKFSDGERERLVDHFKRMTFATYAGRFKGFSGEQFTVLNEAARARGHVLVRTRLVKSDGDKIALNYLLKNYAGRWLIIDVYLDAKYSELARLRAEYTAVLRREGLTTLLAKLEQKIQNAKR